MNPSIREQLAVLFDRRNEEVHTAPSVMFSASFRQLAEKHSIDLNEFSTLLDRGMRPGKALKRLLELQMKYKGREYAVFEYPNDLRAQEAYMRGYVKSIDVDEAVQELVCALKSEPEEVRFATDAEDIRWVYRHGPVSCMVDEDATKIAGICYGSNPCMAVAWVEGSDSRLPAARCVVNLATRTYGRLYGDRSQVLEWGLKALGYKGSPNSSPLVGERMFVPTKVSKDAFRWWANYEVVGYPSPAADPHLAMLGSFEFRTRHFSLLITETLREVTLHAPYIDNASCLVETTNWEWKEFFGERYFGNWMEVVDFAGDFQVIVNEGLKVLSKPDYVDRMWSFSAHAGAMEQTPRVASIIPREWEWEDVATRV